MVWAVFGSSMFAYCSRLLRPARKSSSAKQSPSGI